MWDNGLLPNGCQTVFLINDYLLSLGKDTQAWISELILVTPYGDVNCGQHWLRLWVVAWWHQAITWTNVDISPVRCSGMHLRAISQEILQPWITKISLRITYLKFNSNLPGASELTHLPLVLHVCVKELGHHWFRWWLVAYSAPSHYLNQCWLIVNRTPGNIFQ